MAGDLVEKLLDDGIDRSDTLDMRSPSVEANGVKLKYNDSYHMSSAHPDATLVDIPAYSRDLYDVDLVLIFPLLNGEEEKRPQEYTMKRFVRIMLGTEDEPSRSMRNLNLNGNDEEETRINSFKRVLRTPRCFLSDKGHQLVRTQSMELDQMERFLEKEYEEIISSTEDTTSQQFCELVAKAIARRLQLACGLTTRMFRSCDADEIILTIKADDNDLRVEADRSDYRLQVSNRPFDPVIHGKKLERIREKEKITGQSWDESVKHLRECRGTLRSSDSDNLESDPFLHPELDPFLISEVGAHHQPLLHRKLRQWGHNEAADGQWDDSMKKPIEPVQYGAIRRFFRSITQVLGEDMTYFAPYAEYRIEPMFQPYYRRYPLKWGGKDEETLFAQKDRIRLASRIVKRHINTEALLFHGYLKCAMFALHDERALTDLRSSWAKNWTMVHQPIEKIRFYFGEKVALYFAWLGYCTKMLIFPSLLGIVAHILIESYEDEARTVQNQTEQWLILAGFSFLIVIWSALFTAVWKRKNVLLNALWGLHGFHRKVHYRSEFRGRKSYNPVTDDEEMDYVSVATRRRAFVLSFIVVAMMVGIVIVAIGVLFLLKHFINEKEGWSDTTRMGLTYLVSAINAIQILVFNTIYRFIARRLNEWENHRTDREFENHLVIKVFCFQFCNSFASLFYIAFVKQTVEGKCVNGNCMEELGAQLLILFLIRIVAGNTMEVIIPYIMYRYQLFAERDAVQDKRHNYIEQQAKLVPYEEDEAFEDYNEMIIQYGYITLFVVAYPLTPVLALINNILEVHVDSFKLCYVHRRPYPHQAKSIGAWFAILRLLAIVSLATNVAILLWTPTSEQGSLVDIVDNENPDLQVDNRDKIFVFVICVQVCFLLTILTERLIADAPKKLNLLVQRHDYIVARVFKGLHEGDDSKLSETSEELRLTIHSNEQWTDESDERKFE